MKELLVYIKEYTKECVLGPFFKLLEACFDLAVPLVMASIIDKGIALNDKGYIFKYGGILVLLAIIGLTCSITAQFFAAKAATGFAANLRYALFKHIESLSFTEMDEIGTSTMITRMTSDINQLQSGVNMALRLFLRSPFIVFGAAIMAFTIDIKAALVFVVVIPLLAVVVFGIMLISMPLFKKVQAGLDDVLGITRQNLTGVRVIRAFNKEQAELGNFADANEKLTVMQLFVGRISALTNPVTYVMVNVALLALLWTGGIQVDAGRLTQGEVVALVNYMSQILVELVKLANTIVLTTKAVACGARVQNILAINSSMEEGDYGEEGNSLAKGGGVEVKFEHVGMKYKGAGGNSVSDIDFTAMPGSVTGITGGTGSGKSTLVNLIPRFYDAISGAVLVNGVNVKEYNQKALREKIAVAMQKTELFSGTIKENISWGNPDASNDEIKTAAKTAQADGFINQAENGYNTSLAEGGMNLSGGQKQRISIARAILKPCEILVFDDSTSALDLKTEADLYNALGKFKHDITKIIVAQRIASVRQADKIIILDKGRIASEIS